jgi:hypothetical protein
MSLMIALDDTPILAETKITVGVAAMSPRTIPLIIAQEQVLFPKQGIEARVVLIKGAASSASSTKKVRWTRSRRTTAQSRELNE